MFSAFQNRARRLLNFSLSPEIRSVKSSQTCRAQFAFAALILAAGLSASSQSYSLPQHLDPARNEAVLQQPNHSFLNEEYIWTANDAAALRPDHARFTYINRNLKTEPHFFRGRFLLDQIPPVATLYIAGPRHVHAYLNGKLVLNADADATSPLGTHVFNADVRSALLTGNNVLAIEAVRGNGIVAATDSPVVQQLAFGETLVAKIVAADAEREGPAIAATYSDWRSTVKQFKGWQSPEFNANDWPTVQSLGKIERSADFFQWNTDAGMYDWPGYRGISSYLRPYSLLPVSVSHLAGHITHPESLTKPMPDDEFAVEIPQGAHPIGNSPGLLLDFGREVSGRILVESSCDCTAQVEISYGESESEALNHAHYLGTNLLTIPSHGIARGPKSGFRYVRLQFKNGAPQTRFHRLALEGIAYPVAYKGAFESSDPVLNRIWETAAYTAHLCMQDDVWDGVKRDRGRWAGDLDASAPTILNVFGDNWLLATTLTRLVPPRGQDVNGIPSYSAFWITTLATIYRHNGDKTILEQRRAVVLQLLSTLDNEFDGSGNFLDPRHAWLFVDWAPGMFASAPDAVEGTALALVRGYRDGAWLLGEMGDETNAAVYKSRAKELASQLRRQYLSAGSFGDRWQLNAMAVLASAARETDYQSIWERSLSQVNDATYSHQAKIISPYFNVYVLDALARMGHRREALEWMRRYWGGMLAEGATSFWEAYDLGWPKQDPHASLQADGRVGYFASLAHAWSSGPAAWLVEEVLGIKALEPGFRRTQVRPDLMGLDWARGAVATPRGPIAVNISARHILINLPLGIDASILLPTGTWFRNGAQVKGEVAEHGSRLRVEVHQSGTVEFTQPSLQR